MHTVKLVQRGGMLAAAMWIGLGLQPAAAQTDLRVHALVDVVGRGNDEAVYLNRSMSQDSNFDNLRARLFVDGGTERTRAFIQVKFSDVGYERIDFYGAYVQHKLLADRELYFEAGKIPLHVGTWSPRTYSNKNPLVGIPFAYFYKSTLTYRMMPLDMEQLLSQRGRGQTRVTYTNPDGSPRGVPWSSSPIMYDNCWDYGAFVFGATRSFDWALGTTLGAPASPVEGGETNSSLAIQARVGYSPVAGLQLHVSAARGAYLWDDVAPYMPAGAKVDDYAQTFVGLSLAWGWRHLDVASEIYFNHYETPLRADGLGSKSYYVETQYRVWPGLFVAGRYDAMRFGVVESAAGPVTWDDNLQRLEAGVGYRPTRELLVKAVAQMNDTGTGWDSKAVLPAVQMSFAF